MIADLKPYPAMKDSGVPWLGEVPEHWECDARLRTVLQIDVRVGNTAREERAGVEFTAHGVVPAERSVHGAIVHACRIADRGYTTRAGPR